MHQKSEEQIVTNDLVELLINVIIICILRTYDNVVNSGGIKLDS
jgi:hypothetical protein